MVDFNVKIGMKFSEIETVIKQYGKENESAAKSIFNMIKDEKEMGGDLKVSTLNEKRMIATFLTALGFTCSTKEVEEANGEVVMPDSLAKAKGVDPNSNYNLAGETVSGDQKIFSLKDGEYSQNKIIYNREDGSEVTDFLIDNDGDNLADSRMVIVEKGNARISYYDKDLDGRFDRKIERTNGEPKKMYERSVDEDWQ